MKLLISNVLIQQRCLVTDDDKKKRRKCRKTYKQIRRAARGILAVTLGRTIDQVKKLNRYLTTSYYGVKNTKT